MAFDLKRSKAIVTGGARGFGRDFTRRLLEAGGRVVVADVMEEEARQTVRELGEKYGKDRVTFVRCDVRLDEDWQQLWSESEKFFSGPVNLLVNNAGIAPTGPDSWRRVLDINFIGVNIGAYMALEKMDKSKGGEGGRIVNIASYAGFLSGMGDMYAESYTVAKHGVVALTRSFAGKRAKMGEKGVKAYALCPFFANTKLVSDNIDLNKLERITKNRVLKVEEVGAALMMALKRDKNGACYGIFPDAPLIEHPCLDTWLFVPAYIAVGKLMGMLGGPTHCDDPDQFVLRWPVATAAIAVILAIVLLVVKFVLCLVF